MKRLLIIGCGDIGMRIVRALQSRYKIYGLTHTPANLEHLRSCGVTPVLGNLDDKHSLKLLSGIADEIIHCAPPPNSGRQDSRTRHLLAALGRNLPRRLIYVSTSGVYGNCHGQLIDETRIQNINTERAARRADAEAQLRKWGRRSRVCVCILRAPGIYAKDRLPLPRLKLGIPVLIPAEDVYSNHVHADDLARMVIHAIRWGQSGRTYNANDDTRLKMGDYFDIVADHFDLPRPPRITLQQAEMQIPKNMLTFMRESRRMLNGRVKRELRLRLMYPTVSDGLAGMARADNH